MTTKIQQYLSFWRPTLSYVLLGTAVTFASVGRAAPKTTPKTSRVAATSTVNLPWREVKNGWGPVERNQSNGEARARDGQPLLVNKKRYATGFGCHAPSEIRVPLGERYQTFICDIGFDNEVKTRREWQKPSDRKTRVVFLVYADNQRLYSSNLVTANSPSKTIKVSVRGKKQLRLVVMSVGDARNAHVDWANPRLLR